MRRFLLLDFIGFQENQTQKIAESKIKRFLLENKNDGFVVRTTAFIYDQPAASPASPVFRNVSTRYVQDALFYRGNPPVLVNDLHYNMPNTG